MKPQLTATLEAWASKQKSVDRINASANRKLEPFLAIYEKKAEPINAERDEKLSPLLADIEKLEQEIRSTLLSQVNADGTAPAAVEIDNAIAQVTVDRKREIDAATFMRTVPPRLRLDPAFNGCLSVLIGKAEKFLDKATLARLVRPKLSHSVAITLKTN